MELGEAWSRWKAKNRESLALSAIMVMQCSCCIVLEYVIEKLVALYVEKIVRRGNARACFLCEDVGQVVRSHNTGHICNGLCYLFAE